MTPQEYNMAVEEFADRIYRFVLKSMAIVSAPGISSRTAMKNCGSMLKKLNSVKPGHGSFQPLTMR